MVTLGRNTEECLEIFRGDKIAVLFYIFRTQFRRDRPFHDCTDDDDIVNVTQRYMSSIVCWGLGI